MKTIDCYCCFAHLINNYLLLLCFYTSDLEPTQKTQLVFMYCLQMLSKSNRHFFSFCKFDREPPPNLFNALFAKCANEHMVFMHFAKLIGRPQKNNELFLCLQIW